MPITACPHCRYAACYAYLIIKFTFFMDLSPPFHSGTAARRDGVCDRLKFKHKVKYAAPCRMEKAGLSSKHATSAQFQLDLRFAGIITSGKSR
jgi:hypothetical protein